MKRILPLIFFLSAFIVRCYDDSVDSIRYLISVSEDSSELMQLKSDLALYLEGEAVDFIEKGQYSLAMRYLVSAMGLNDTVGNQKSLSYNYSLMGVLFDKSRNYEKAQEYFERALLMFSERKDTIGVGMATLNLSNLFYASKNFEEALKSYKKCLQTKGVISSRNGLAICYNNMGHAYRELGQYDSANYYFQKVLDSIELESYPGLFIHSLNSIAQNHFDIGNYQESSLDAYQAVELARKYNDLPNLKDGYRIYAESSALRGDFKKAYRFNKLYQEIKDSLFSNQRDKQLSELETVYNVRQKEMEIAALRTREALSQQRNRQQIIMLISIGVVLLLFLILMVNSYRLKSYSLRQESKYLKEREALSHLELESKQMEIDHKRRELSTSALHVMNKNEMLSQIKGIVQEQLKNAVNKDVILSLNNITKFIDENIRLDEGWEQFKLHFDSVHPQFFSQLSKNYPSLTNSEMRLCAYILMNLETKEIAQILSITSDSVSKKKGRLKVKLGLSSAFLIQDKLQQISRNP